MDNSVSSRSAALRREIESRLASRIPAALSPQPVQPPRLLPIQNKAVNDLLGGGLPIGGICEFTGAVSAGKTSLALSVLSEATTDAACAYIDVTDSLDARSAAAAGVRLTNLLWVRFSQEKNLEQPAQRSNVMNLVTSISDDASDRFPRHHGIRHPRSETKGIDVALENMLVRKAEYRLKKMEGTPGFPNQRLSLAAAPEEQIAYEHFNARRADPSDPLRQMNHKAANNARQRARSFTEVPNGLTKEERPKKERPWSKLDKALKTADQILQSGGFRVIVLDLASIPAEQALRIPTSIWYRFNRAADEGDAILLLLTQEACSRSSAKCVLYCSARSSNDQTSQVLRSMAYSVKVVRQRITNSFGKKEPSRAVDWDSTAPWMRTVGR